MMSVSARGIIRSAGSRTRPGLPLGLTSDCDDVRLAVHHELREPRVHLGAVLVAGALVQRVAPGCGDGVVDRQARAVGLREGVRVVLGFKVRGLGWAGKQGLGCVLGSSSGFVLGFIVPGKGYTV